MSDNIDDTLNAYRAEIDRLTNRFTGLLARIRSIHSLFGVYAECDCDPDAKDKATHVDVEDVGLTCNLTHFICRECCTNNGYQREDCADYHSHGKGHPICATAAALHPQIGRAAS